MSGTRDEIKIREERFTYAIYSESHLPEVDIVTRRLGKKELRGCELKWGEKIREQEVTEEEDLFFNARMEFGKKEEAPFWMKKGNRAWDF